MNQRSKTFIPVKIPIHSLKKEVVKPGLLKKMNNKIPAESVNYTRHA